MTEPLVLTLEELASAMLIAGVEVSDLSPLATLDLELHARPGASEKLAPPHLEALRAVCAPERRLTVLDHAAATRHAFYLRGEVAAQLVWGERQVVVSPPQSTTQVRAALERKALSSAPDQPVTISASLLEALSAIFRVNDLLVERRSRSQAISAVADVLQLDDLLELGAMSLEGQEVHLAPPFKPILAGLFSGEIISIESVALAGQPSEPVRAMLLGPAGRRIAATDIVLFGRAATLFVSLDAERSRRWAEYLVS